MCPPEAQCITSAAVVDPGAQLLEDKALECGTVDFGWCVQRTARPDGAENAGIEEIELVVPHKPALRASREWRESRGDKQINEYGKIRVNHRTGNAAVARYVGRRVKGAMGEGNRFKEAGECRKVADEPLVLDFFADVECHVCRQGLAPIVGGNDERNHAADKSILKVEVVAHLGGEKRVAELYHRPAREQVNAASLKLARAGAGKYVLAGIPIALNETMHNRKQGADALHLVHNYGSGFGRSVHKLRKAFWICFKSSFDIFAQQVDEKGARVCLAQPSRLSGAARPEKKEVSSAAVYGSLVSHRRYDTTSC